MKYTINPNPEHSRKDTGEPLIFDEDFADPLGTKKFPLSESSERIHQWTHSIIPESPRHRPFLIISGDYSPDLVEAISRAARLFYLKWKPSEEIKLPVRYWDLGDCAAAQLLPRETESGDDQEDWGLLDGTLFERNSWATDSEFLVLWNFHILPPDQGGSFRRLLLSRIGGKRVRPLIIHHPRGVEGMRKQLRKEWEAIEPIMENHSILRDF